MRGYGSKNRKLQRPQTIQKHIEPRNSLKIKYLEYGYFNQKLKL